MLVANRGEIALRIIRTLKEMGIKTVAVYSKADKGMPYTKLADESICIGLLSSRDSYLNTYKILSVATMTGCDSIHPGIGFFAESDNFSKLCQKAGIHFIGASSEQIQNMGNKKSAKEIADRHGLPTIKGSSNPIQSIEDCIQSAEEIGYPVILKATYGGGGKGIRVIHSVDEIENCFELCRKEAQASFGNNEVILEQYLNNTRHVEVQIVGDKYGNVIHLGDRECTIQREKQKILEEAPCQNIDENIRQQLYDHAVRLGKAIGYVGVGTIEFLVLPDNRYYFLEMNPRLQVEHTITELITGIDIVKKQIQMCGGEKLSITQSDVSFTGYALQCRVLAESVKNGFHPSIGIIDDWYMPGGLGVRVDSGYAVKTMVSPYYDSLLVKICCHTLTKVDAVNKMSIALQEIVIAGIENNIEVLKYIMADPEFLVGNYDEKYFAKVVEKFIGGRNRKDTHYIIEH